MSNLFGPPFSPEIASKVRQELQHQWGQGDPTEWIVNAAAAANVDTHDLRFVSSDPVVVRLGIEWVYRFDEDEEIVWMRPYLRKVDPYYESAQQMGADGDIDDAEYWPPSNE